jgi:histidinol-phosphate aminotransferase
MMSKLNRRQWMRRSLLASSAMVVFGQADLMAKATNGLSSDHPLLLLNWNENPYGPSKKAIYAVNEALKKANRYPDAQVDDLKRQIGEMNHLEPDKVLVTAGSLEVLSLIGQHAGILKGEILTPWPTFPTMMRFGEVCGATIKKVPHDKQQVTDLKALKNAITDETKVIFVCNPNNPTSTEVVNEDLVKFLMSVPPEILVCVDEAYIEYSHLGMPGSMARFIKDLPNLVVSRTFSKAYGLAGLRIGYALSQKQNIDALKARHTGNQISTSIASISAASASLKDTDFIEECLKKNQEGKEILYQAFDSWKVPYYKSSTNFVYAQSHPFDKDIVAKLKLEKILISQWENIMTGHIRISIGTPENMVAFVKSVEKYLV